MTPRYHSPDPKYTKTYSTLAAARKAAEVLLAPLQDTAEIKVILTAVEMPDGAVRFTPMFHLWGEHRQYARYIADCRFFVVA